MEQGFDFGIDRRYRDTGVDILDLIPDITVAPIRSFLDEPVTKLIVRLPHPAPAGTAALVQEIVGSRALVTHSTHESFLELSDPRVHKAHTVELLLEEHGHTPWAWPWPTPTPTCWRRPTWSPPPTTTTGWPG